MPLSIPIPPDSVAYVSGTGYFVPSKSVEGAFRLVWGNECSCPATGPSCRHRRLVAAFCAKQDAERRPARSPVNAGLMCD